jgi:hypothetical protein
MTEALENAKQRRDALAAEIGKLDDYICIWEKLVKNLEMTQKKSMIRLC